VYVLEEKNIELLSVLGDKKHCFQTVKIRQAFRPPHDIYLFATSTDGKLSVWNLNHTLERYKEILREREDEKCEDSMLASTSVHVNKERYKFHELEEALTTNALLSLQENLHSSGINSIDLKEVFNPGLFYLLWSIYGKDF